MTMHPESDIVEFELSIPVDASLAKGFGVSVVVHALVLLLLFAWIAYSPPRENVDRIPMEVIYFGLGAGTGAGGNLSAPGAPLKGEKPANPMEDADRRQQAHPKASQAQEYSPGAHVIPKSNVANNTNLRDSSRGAGRHNYGAQDGTPGGAGLGGDGTGPGSGYGFGISWGGGGNRIVLAKVLPHYPAGVDKNAQIKIRFTVHPDGSIGTILPMQKGDPRLEDAAIHALRQWKFNSLSAGSNEQVGVITFSFQIE
jgi:protein TonB